MYSSDQICQKINNLFPDLGDCGKDVNVSYDSDQHTFTVSHKKGGKELKTFLDSEDTRACLEKDQCIGVGFDIVQLRENVKEIKYA